MGIEENNGRIKVVRLLEQMLVDEGKDELDEGSNIIIVLLIVLTIFAILILLKFVVKKCKGTNTRNKVSVVATVQSIYRDPQIIEGVQISTVNTNCEKCAYIIDPEDPNNPTKLQMVRISPISTPLKYVCNNNFRYSDFSNDKDHNEVDLL